MSNLITVTVYTAGPACMSCTQTKRHLDRRGIPYTEIPIDRDPDIYNAIEELDLRTGPVVCVSTTEGETYWDAYRPDRIDALVPLLRRTA